MNKTLVNGYKVVYTVRRGERREPVTEYYPCRYGMLDVDKAKSDAQLRASELRKQDVAACVEGYS